ncbi:MAG: GIY-YIG nuclease family protein [Bacteroidia bacterium]
MRDHNYFVYITCNPGKTTFYTGVTNDLERRIKDYENRGTPKTFAGKYYCYKLIFFERFSDINMAIEREKEIKDLSRAKKIDLIKNQNPNINFIAVRFELSGGGNS